VAQNDSPVGPLDTCFSVVYCTLRRAFTCDFPQPRAEFDPRAAHAAVLKNFPTNVPFSSVIIPEACDGPSHSEGSSVEGLKFKINLEPYLGVFHCYQLYSLWF
jgi:hypothetical protein